MDIKLIKVLAEEYDKGRKDHETVMAKACLECYQQGFDEGVEKSEQAHINTHVLMNFTSGNA